MEGLPAEDTHPPDMTVIIDRFSPRFTPHLTHRQEASEGASCPPDRVALGQELLPGKWIATSRASAPGVK